VTVCGEDEVGVTDWEENPQVIVAGGVQVRFTGWLNPPIEETMREKVAVFPAGTAGEVVIKEI
jgi:hypothetical protein